MAAPTKSTARFVLSIVFTSLVLLTLPSYSESSNILFFIGFGGPSHRIAMQPFANTLASKGHNVTFIVQYMPKADKANHKDIQYRVPQKVVDSFAKMKTDFYELRASGRAPFMGIFIQGFGLNVCHKMYDDSDFMEWLHSVPKFDLVIMDGLFNECGYGIAHAHGAKTILFSVSTILPWAIDAIGAPDESSFIPDVMSGIPLHMNFAHRVFGAISPVFWNLFRNWYYLPAMRKISMEGLKLDSFPDYAELERNTSLVLVNTHVSQEYARALPPNVISVGGISWVDKQKPLTKKMEDFINEGKEGFIYVSFGSFIDFLTFPEEVQQTFLNALKQYPNIQFIWKLEKTPENLPKHILVEKWLPQQDLLLHPKIRAFITHSGIGGVNEAIYSAVPLICFPILTEQDYNANLVEKRGFGIKLEITALTQQDMVQAIRKIITDNSYKENAKKVAQQFIDRPMKPLDTAVWWTEFVLRQESTEFLRSETVDQSWWKRRKLDVWLFLFLLTIAVNTLGLYVSYKVLKLCLKKSNSTAVTTGGLVKKSIKKGKQKQY